MILSITDRPGECTSVRCLAFRDVFSICSRKCSVVDRIVRAFFLLGVALTIRKFLGASDGKVVFFRKFLWW